MNIQSFIFTLFDRQSGFSTHHAGEIENAALFLRLDLPSFSKTFFNSEKFENADFAFTDGRKTV